MQEDGEGVRGGDDVKDGLVVRRVQALPEALMNFRKPYAFHVDHDLVQKGEYVFCLTCNENVFKGAMSGPDDKARQRKMLESMDEALATLKSGLDN